MGVWGRRGGVVAGVLVAGVAVAGCGSVDVAGAPVEREVFAFQGRELVVDSVGSDLVVGAGDVEDVRVERQVGGWGVGGSGPEARWELVDGRLRIRVECDGIASGCGAVHRVLVPRDVAVSVTGEDGDVAVEGFATAVKVRSDNGDVRVSKVSGALDIGSDNGDVRAEDGLGSGEVVVRSDNGDVRLSFGVVPRRVDVAGDNGDLTVTLPRAEYEVSGSSGNGDRNIDVPVREGSGRKVSLRSDNGDVTVRTAN
ncbi:DUF4097 family beta strand repeat-containing protein [Streptomyces sp. NPDC058758]|uniref:DUF4097 family beta strand repeat-containing protein n=1 Tax=Streptomyces sp. NPDC058758 TaxID=3346627 RepID=UPI0036A4C671